MDNQGRQVLFIVLSIVILFTWMYFMPAPPPETANAPVTQAQAAVSASSARSVPSSVSSPASVRTKASHLKKTVELPVKEVTIETDEYKATFSNQGAVLTGFQLKKYLNRQTKKFSQLVNPDPERPKPFSVNFSPLPDINKTTFEVEGSSKNLSKMDNTAQLVFRSVDNNGIVLEKTFTFKNGSYLMDFNMKVSQTGRDSIPAFPLSVEWADTLGKEENLGGTSSRVLGYRVATFSGDRVSSESPEKNQNSAEISAPVHWTALANQFFVAALIPDPASNGASTRVVRDHNVYMTPTDEDPNPKENPKVFGPRPLLIFPGSSLRSGDSFQCKGMLYFGPQDYALLQGLNLQLERVIDFGYYGWFDYISVHMLALLRWFFSWAHNWGLAIILLSLSVKLLLWWPTHNSYKTMAQTQSKMKEIQPKLEAIKRKYADDKQEQQKQTMAIYQTAGINPMNGCLPMVLQMPIFFALYSTLSHCIELRGASFLWLGDLTLSDPIHVFPLLMGASMVVQQRVSGQMTNQAAGQQKVMMWMLPIILTYASFSWPGGLLVYWVVTNVLSMIQQKVVNREIQKAKRKVEVA